MSSLPAEIFDKLRAFKIAETREILWVSVREQKLRLFVNRRPTGEFSVSTAAKGIGCTRNSHQTPTGLHRIAQKIGDGEPAGTIFKERVPVGVRSQKSEARSLENQISNHESRMSNLEPDLILTRIVWLEGLEPGVNQGGNVDTFARYIYIHGTNHEDRIGQPASHGCVRMRNDDVIKVFDQVSVGSLVWLEG